MSVYGTEASRRSDEMRGNSVSVAVEQNERGGYDGCSVTTLYLGNAYRLAVFSIRRHGFYGYDYLAPV